MEKPSSVECTGASVQEAIAAGLAQLGLPENRVRVEIVAQGGDSPARVRLTPRAESAGGEEDLDATREVVEALISRMHLEGSLETRWVDAEDDREMRHVMVDIHGPDLGLMVSRRGEALSALQYLIRLILTRRLGVSLPVVVDIDGYREKREQQLRRMARRAADQAQERGRTVILEPMPANERRVVHLTLRDFPGVLTESTGEGQSRKVMILPKP